MFIDEFGPTVFTILCPIFGFIILTKILLLTVFKDENKD